METRGIAANEEATETYGCSGLEMSDLLKSMVTQWQIHGIEALKVLSQVNHR
jgi:hypothetical protein